jgi:16S rRNA (uracil1498-N3)-methyltransferase
MRIPRVYVDLPLSSNTQVDLPSPQAHYLVKVLRMANGRALIVFNGEGGEYSATLNVSSKQSASVKLREHDPVNRESPLAINLAIGLSKGDRFEWVIQKATELGVASIQPLFTERTEVKLAQPRLEKKLEHWQQIAISACEQSQRTQIPKIIAPLALADWLTQGLRRGFVLHHRHDQSLQDTSAPLEGFDLLIGPEGGLSSQEISLAQQHGLTALTLGPRVMRTETAPLAALSILQFLWGDLN